MKIQILEQLVQPKELMKSQDKQIKKDWNELKQNINKIRREARITFIESPFGYIDDSFFENKVWNTIEKSLEKELASQKSELINRVEEMVGEDEKWIIPRNDDEAILLEKLGSDVITSHRNLIRQEIREKLKEL